MVELGGRTETGNRTDVNGKNSEPSTTYCYDRTTRLVVVGHNVGRHFVSRHFMILSADNHGAWRQWRH